MTSQSITPPADQVKCQKYIILCRRAIIYDLQLLRKINNRDMTLLCAFVLACGLNVVIGVVSRAMKTANKTWTITHPLVESHFVIHVANCSSKFRFNNDMYDWPLYHITSEDIFTIRGHKSKVTVIRITI